MDDEEQKWADRLFEIAEVLLALGDAPVQGVVHQFVRRAASDELHAYLVRPVATAKKASR